MIEEKGSLASQSTYFSTYSATQTLHQLAQQPFHLTGHLTPERIAHYYAEACGLRLLYATEQVNEEILQVLFQLAIESQAISKMAWMQKGEIVNFIEGESSEHRPALHTATRDFFKHPQSSSKAKEAALLAKQQIDRLQSFMAKIDLEDRFHEIVLIGIGGSDLGPRAHYQALRHLQKPHRHVHFISNLDPDEAAQVLKQVQLDKALIVVASKSGTTLETLANEAFVRERFLKGGLKPHEHFISITMPGTPLDDSDRFFTTFYVWDWIGGRFSTTSMMGGLLLSFAYGFEVYWELLRGANAMDKVALIEGQQNLPLLAALLSIWNHDFLHYPTFALIPYVQALFRYPAHIQQVEMESNGKLITQQGQFVDFETSPIVWGEPGTNAQHSFFQLLHQGTTPVSVLMIGFKESQYQEDVQMEGTSSQEKLLANLFAQSLALALGQSSEEKNRFFPGNRPTSILLGQQLTPYTLGALLAFFEHRTAFQGFIWGINSFDQEGVQLGKKLATKLLQCFTEQKEERPTSYSLGEAFLKHLNQVKTPLDPL
jgi:glucose-6-phosphate isomerase